jgi:hypothetical protein
MIISASYKTDIPAFYGEWFMNRLSAGYCKTVNPFNRKVRRVSLESNTVDGIVFWTKNLIPFEDTLERIDAAGYPFTVHYTINGYPRELETSVVYQNKSVEAFCRVAKQFGKSVGVWRYDTIIDSTITPLSSHIRTFEYLAERLEGSTDEVVISFMQLYKKTVQNMDRAASEHGFQWLDGALEDKMSLASTLAEIAEKYSIKLSICGQRELLVPGSGDARCIDADRMGKVAGSPVQSGPTGARKGCGCHRSIDIGEYDTCPHGCVYCYAVRNNTTARRNFKRHDPTGEFLLAPANGKLDAKDDDTQLSLLGELE